MNVNLTTGDLSGLGGSPISQHLVVAFSEWMQMPESGISTATEYLQLCQDATVAPKHSGTMLKSKSISVLQMRYISRCSDVWFTFYDLWDSAYCTCLT